jgi:hypothetical protein
MKSLDGGNVLLAEAADQEVPSEEDEGSAGVRLRGRLGPVVGALEFLLRNGRGVSDTALPTIQKKKTE